MGDPMRKPIALLLQSAAWISISSLSGIADAQTSAKPPTDDRAARTSAKPSTDNEAIVVTADRRNSFGQDYLQAGAFRDSRIIDTPLTVSVISRDVLDAQQAQTIMDAAKNTAGVSQSQINSTIYSNLSIRGIPVDNFTNYRLNG